MVHNFFVVITSPVPHTHKLQVNRIQEHSVCVCVCVCARARACVHVPVSLYVWCVCVCVQAQDITFVYPRIGYFIQFIWNSGKQDTHLTLKHHGNRSHSTVRNLS